ncbi:MAG TPA: carboxypeptidase-like regulatory domain-containing protein [Gemmatimonadaceae bacterium]
MIRWDRPGASCLGLVGILAVTPLIVPAQVLSTVRGTVTNEAARTLEQARVTLDPDGANRQVRTDREGRFSFLGVPAGAHQLRVTWVGFAPESRRIDVTTGDVTVDVTLRRLTYLDPVAVVGRRTGLYGSVISSDSLLPVPNARIEIIGARTADSTTASGTFNFPQLKPGAYIVRVKHPFFESRNFAISVPVGGGTELDVVVLRGRVSRDQHMEMFYREMDSRLTFRGINTAFVPVEILKGREKMPLDKALAFAPEVAKKALFVPSDVCLFVDGIARPGANLADFSPEDIESVELYGAAGRTTMSFSQGMPSASTSRAVQQADPTRTLSDRWPPRTPCGREPLPSETRLSASTVKVIFAVVWTKR